MMDVRTCDGDYGVVGFRLDSADRDQGNKIIIIVTLLLLIMMMTMMMIIIMIIIMMTWWMSGPVTETTAWSGLGWIPQTGTKVSSGVV